MACQSSILDCEIALQYNEFHQQYTSFGSPYGAQPYKHQLESLYEIKELSYELASDDDKTAADLFTFQTPQYSGASYMSPLQHDLYAAL
ncbi:hypothetical protein MIR68_004055 [Amoeboaphelidium protococcarum]|nr:hypothetical protein MIR68_004055 [Amoeboaphelidium protococcarum]